MSRVKLSEPNFSIYSYEYPGPIGGAYCESFGPIDLIMGPGGSGKSVASVYKGLIITTALMPICRDGVIRAKGTIVRDTYTELFRTTLKTWQRWFPKEFPASDFQGGVGRPIEQTLRFFNEERQAPVELLVDMFAVKDFDYENALKSYETSWVYLNEFNSLPKEVVTFFFGRTGRYPPREELMDPDVLMPRIVFGDTNPPSVKHWLYDTCVRKKQKGWNFFWQPSGLAPEGENRKGKPRVEYEREAELAEDELDIMRMVHGQFGYSRDGKPVYRNFKHAIHVPKAPMKPAEGLPLIIGCDAGGSPAMVIGQQLPSGHLRWLREVCAEPGTGIGRFVELVLHLLATDLRGHAISHGWGDPSAFYGADRQAGELAWMEAVGRALNVNIMPAPSNETGIRIEAVDLGLKTLIDGVPVLTIDPSMETTIEGFVSEYKWQRNNDGSYRTDRPVKNGASHVHDAGQYLMLGARGRADVINAAAKAGRAGNVVPLSSGRPVRGDFNVWGV